MLRKKVISFFLVIYLVFFQFISIPQKTYAGLPLILAPVAVTWLAGLKQVLASSALIGVTGWTTHRIISDGLAFRTQQTYNSLTTEQRAALHSAIATSTNGSTITLTSSQLDSIGASHILSNINREVIQSSLTNIPTSSQIVDVIPLTIGGLITSHANAEVPQIFFDRTRNTINFMQHFVNQFPQISLNLTWQTVGARLLTNNTITIEEGTQPIISRHIASRVRLTVTNNLTNATSAVELFFYLGLPLSTFTRQTHNIGTVMPALNRPISDFYSEANIHTPLQGFQSVVNHFNATGFHGLFTTQDIENFMFQIGTGNTFIPANISVSGRITSNTTIKLPPTIVVPRNTLVTSGNTSLIPLVPTAVTTANPIISTALTTGTVTPDMTTTVISVPATVVTPSPIVLPDGLMGTLTAIYQGIIAIPTSIARFFDLTIPINLTPLQVAGQTFTTRFPFSIPWDIARGFAISNNAGNFSPRFDININTGLLGRIQFSIDFTAFQHLIAIQRDFLILLFIIGLAILTPKITKV